MRFFVAGIPVPKGSAKAFVNKKTGRAIVTQTNGARQRPWASAISLTAQEKGCKPTQGAVQLTLTFSMPRPKSHYGTGKNSCVLKTSAPLYHTSTPDLDKLTRCVKDALTGVAWFDDSQVTILNAIKVYGDNPGVVISIIGLDGL